MCSLEDFNHLRLAPPHRLMLEGELEDWHTNYLPRGGLKGKNVLDLGAGCGETAQFFLNHGAALVRPVESETYAYNLLRDNFAADPRISWEGPFRIDFIKCDCEGGEKDMFVETHFPVIIKPTKMSRISCPNSNGWKFQPIPGGQTVWPTWLAFHNLTVQLLSYAVKTRIFVGYVLRRILP